MLRYQNLRDLKLVNVFKSCQWWDYRPICLFILYFTIKGKVWFLDVPIGGDFQWRSVYVSLADKTVCHFFLSSHWWIRPSHTLLGKNETHRHACTVRMCYRLPYTSTVEQRNYWWTIPHKIRQRRYNSFSDLSDCHKSASFICYGARGEKSKSRVQIW